MARPERSEETAKTTFVLPVDLLAELREFCHDHSIGRSRFAERAVRELLDREQASGRAAPWDWGNR